MTTDVVILAASLFANILGMFFICSLVLSVSKRENVIHLSQIAQPLKRASDQDDDDADASHF